jgi:hypothetical protein
MMKQKAVLSRAVAAAALLALLLGGMGQAGAQAASRYFPETNHTVSGAFLIYWNNNGALVQQGYPITEEYPEVNDIDGKTYNTQYFQRARFEFHPEIGDQNNQVLLGLLGTEAFLARYHSFNTAVNPVIMPGGGSRFFPDTGHTVTGLFLDYWNTHGGLRQQGFPISEAFVETSLTDGRPYVTQYFQRARFEYHPEISDQNNQVLLGLVGVEIYQRKVSGGGPAPTPTQVAGGGNCAIAVHQVFQYSITNNPDLATQLGCPTDAGADNNSSSRVHGGYQKFRYGVGMIISQDGGPNYVYGLHPNQTFMRVDYGGVGSKGGDPPLPGPHFVGTAGALALGPATGDEDFGDGGYQNYQNGTLYYVGSQTQLVFAIIPAGATSGTWAEYKSRAGQ